MINGSTGRADSCVGGEVLAEPAGTRQSPVSTRRMTSDSRHAVVRGPSFTEGGYFPDLTPDHHEPADTGTIGRVPLGRCPMMSFRRKSALVCCCLWSFISRPEWTTRPAHFLAQTRDESSSLTSVALVVRRCPVRDSAGAQVRIELMRPAPQGVERHSAWYRSSQIGATASSEPSIA